MLTTTLGLTAMLADARAETCPALDAPSGSVVDGAAQGAIDGGALALTGFDADVRARYLDAALRRAHQRGRIWTHAWGWSLVGVSAGQVGAAQLLYDDADDRAVWYVSASKAALGVIWTFAFDSPRVAVPEIGAAPTCADVARAEEALIRAARRQRIGWRKHAEGIALNVAAVLYLGLVHDRWGKGALGAAIGFAVGEFRLYTRPKGAISALARYRAGDLGAAAGGGVAWTAAPAIGPDWIGVSVSGSF